MKRGTFITVTISTLTALIGCDRAQPAGNSPAPATTQASNVNGPGAVASSSNNSVPTTTPATSEMTIDGALVRFPPARLRVRKDDQAMVALLYSAKPDRKNARQADHDDNSYYLQMDLGELPGEGQQQSLNDASWAFKAPTSDPVDSPNGIFLDGTDKHLQPQDVVVQFEELPQSAEAPQYVIVYLTGRFLLVEESDDSTMPGHFVTATATLTAQLDGNK
jgi:hypothetical protein